MNHVIVHKGRTEIVPVSLGYSVVGQVITSEIRLDKNPESPLLATWEVSFKTDGSDGELILRLDNSATQNIEKATGYMDLKRVVGGEPMNVFDEPLEVLFKEIITA